MADRASFVIESALIGHLVSLRLLAQLVDKGVISPAAVAEILDDVLLHLEEWQALFPEYQESFEGARELLSASLAGYRAMPKRQSD